MERGEEIIDEQHSKEYWEDFWKVVDEIKGNGELVAGATWYWNPETQEYIREELK